MMKIAVISYSLAANNKALVNSIAEKFDADHINITETKSRTMGSI